jgi:hypothetical protein
LSLFLRVTSAILISQSAWCGHTLQPGENTILAVWLTNHPAYRVAYDEDCKCSADIQCVKAGSGGIWKGLPDYHPYVATGDFNGDGLQDFAVVVLNSSTGDFALLVFNGPFNKKSAAPALFHPRLDLKGSGLFYGPPRPKPYRLVMGPFESEGAVLTPSGRTYIFSTP